MYKELKWETYSLIILPDNNPSSHKWRFLCQSRPSSLHPTLPSRRTDSGQPNMNNVGGPGYSWAAMTGEGLKNTFTKAGFGPR